jgi:hypothetical protein
MSIGCKASFEFRLKLALAETIAERALPSIAVNARRKD